MKRTLLFLLFALSLSYLGWGQTAFTATYTFGANGNVASFTYNGTTYTGITPGPIVKVGVTTSSSTGNFRATGWPTGATNGSNTFTGSVDLAKYIGFTIDAVSGYKFTVTSITFGLGRSGTGTRQSQWRGSFDAYGSILTNYSSLASGLTNSSGVLTNTDENSSWAGNILTVGANYVDISTSVGFRYYLYNSEASSGTGGIQTSVTITGTYQLTSDVTAPSWTATYPKAENATPSGFTSKVNINEPGTAYFVVLPNGADAPNSAQVKAGQDANGDPLASNLKGTIACALASTEYTTAVTGLTSSTNYDVYFVAQDDETTPNLQASPTMVEVATTADASSSSIVESNGGEQATISSLENDATISSALDGVNVWNLYVLDGGGTADADTKPTIYTGFVFTAGELNTVTNWTNTIQAAALFDNTTLTKVADAVIGSNSLTFSGFTYSVADDDLEELILLISLKTTVTDNQKFQFSLVNSGITTESSNTSSQIDPAMLPVESDGAKNIIDVAATKLAFLQQPSNTLVNVDMTPAVTVRALDANNNRDLDASAQVAITSTGTLSDAQSNALSSGLATFGNIMHSETGTDLELTAEATGLTSAVSSFFDVFMELSVGDIGFVGYATDGSDNFGFLALTNIEAGLEIKFTDNAWTGSALATNEGTLTWITPAEGVAKGTVVIITPPSTASLGTVSGANFAMATSGDQILAYQGSSLSPNFLAGVSSTNWITTGSTTSNTSYLPAPLTLNSTALAFSSEMDNGYYNGPQTLANGSVLNFISNSGSWLRDDAAQTFPAWSFTIGSQSTIDVNTTIQDLTIESGEVLQINSTKGLSVTGTLTNNVGPSGIVIKSDATGTGSLISSTEGVEATVERYLINYTTQDDQKFHFISSPVSEQAIRPDFVANTPLAGVDFYKFDEVNNLWINTKMGEDPDFYWNEDFENNFTVGNGYMVAYPTSPVTKNFTGTLNAGTYTTGTNMPALTNTPAKGNGWNLLGNPFPSAIDWDLVTKEDGVDAALYYYDASIENYRYYIKLDGEELATDGGSRYIPAMQGFMVHAKSTGTKTVTIEDADRVHQAQTVFYKTAATIPGSLSLKVNAGGYEDVAFVHFNDGATTQFDGNYDAFKLFSYNETVPQIYTLSSDDKKLAINGLPDLSNTTEVLVSFKPGTTGTQVLTADVSQLPANAYLHDLKTGALTDLRQNPAYTFTATTTDAPNRFKLTFGAVGIDTPVASPISIYTYANRLHILNAGNATVEIISMAGQVVERFGVNETGTFSRQLNQPAGTYVVRVISGNTVRTERIVIN